MKRGVHGGGKVRDLCVGREGWLGRARGKGWWGRGDGAPRVELGLLAPAWKTEKRKVTSTPEVPGPSRSWNPARRRCSESALSPAPAPAAAQLLLRLQLRSGGLAVSRAGELPLFRCQLWGQGERGRGAEGGGDISTSHEACGAARAWETGPSTSESDVAAAFERSFLQESFLDVKSASWQTGFRYTCPGGSPFHWGSIIFL